MYIIALSEGEHFVSIYYHGSNIKMLQNMITRYNPSELDIDPSNVGSSLEPSL